MRRIVITGGSGFLGTELVNGLLKNMAFKKDRFYFVGRKKPDFIEEWRGVSRLNFISLDLSDLVMLRELRDPIFKAPAPGGIDVEIDFKCDILIHLAAQTPKTEDENLDAVNTYCLRPIIELFKPKCVIFTSTIDVYDYSLKDKITEESKIGPKTHYGNSKVNAEIILSKFKSKYKFELVILRLTNIYGSIDPYLRVINQFIKYGQSSGRIYVNGLGKQKRDLMHIDDFTRAMLYVIDKPVAGIYNVGSGRSIRIMDLAIKVRDLILTKIGKQAKILSIFDLKADRSIDLDVSKFNKTFNFCALISIDAGILRIMGN